MRAAISNRFQLLMLHVYHLHYSCHQVHKLMLNLKKMLLGESQFVTIIFSVVTLLITAQPAKSLDYLGSQAVTGSTVAVLLGVLNDDGGGCAHDHANYNDIDAS